MNAPILNRQFQHPADGWYHIEPQGEHPNTEAEVVQVIDSDAVRAIVNRFNSDAEAGKLSHGHEMLVDHEHFSHDTDKETRAFGWLNRLQGREDGIYGQVRWSATGKTAVDGGDYRFFSTEYDPGDFKILNRAPGAVRGRPLRLAGLTLTNRPNNKGGRPITNRQPADPAPAAEPLADKPKRSMKQIAAKLGLSADASEEAVIGEVIKLQNRATGAEEKLAPLTTERDTLKNRVTVLLGEQIDADLAAHGITEEATIGKLKLVLNRMETRQERVDFLALIPAPEAKNQAKPAKPVLTNREKAQTPGGTASGAAPDLAVEQRKAVAIRNRAAVIEKSTPGINQVNAWIRASKEVEEEFASGASK
jgi:phage I-like protein